MRTKRGTNRVRKGKLWRTEVMWLAEEGYVNLKRCFDRIRLIFTLVGVSDFKGDFYVKDGLAQR